MIPFEKIAEKLGGWAHYFKPFYDSGGFEKIYTQLKEEGSTIKIVPEGKDLFKAFELCPVDKLKTIWVSQDPYPMIKQGKVVADGLSYSCSHTKEEQPSLKKIFDSIETELFDGLNLAFIREPDLTYLASQGILLLNSALTCQEEKPGSHKELWNQFMNYFFTEVLCNFRGIPIVFMGKQAQYYNKFPCSEAFFIKEVEHPAKACYENRDWKSDGLFKWTNEIIKKQTGEEIDWICSPPF